MFGTAIQEVGVMDVEALETRSDKSLYPVGESKEGLFCLRTHNLVPLPIQLFRILSKVAIKIHKNINKREGRN
jgi:hypothetical protein